MQFWSRLRHDMAGINTADCAIVAGLIALAIVSAITLFGSNLKPAFAAVATAF